MKKVTVAACLVLLFFSCLSVSAENTDGRFSSDESKALIDTIVCKVVRSLSPLMDNTSFVGSELDSNERLLLEYMMYDVSRDTYEQVLSGFTDEQLRALSHAYSMTAGWFCMLEQMTVVLNEAFNFEIGERPYFDYDLKDKEYSALVDRLFETAKDPRVFEKTIRDMSFMIVQNAREAGADDEAISIIKAVVNRVGTHLIDLIKLAYIEYFDKDDLRDVIDAFSCDELRDVIPALRALDQMPSPLEVDIEKAISDRDEKAFYEYLAVSRSLPYPFLLKSRPYMEMTIGNSYYSGQTRDLSPHGHGVLVDKKGVVYKGDFRRGNRHGLIEVTKPGAEPVLEIWADDKHRKTLHTDTEEYERVPDPGLYRGAFFGYGSTYDSETSTICEGYFVDGRLHGTGVRKTPAYTCSGVFEDGAFREGVMTWNEADWKINEFRGICSGKVRKGIHHRVSSDGSKEEVFEGLFVNGNLDGQGQYVIKTPSDTSVMKGLFAMGSMFGEGCIRYSKSPDNNGITETSVYEGGLAYDLASGMGRCTITLSDVPDGNWWFRRFGVKVSDVAGGTDVVIKITGYFENGCLKEGRVEVSDGNVMSGVFENEVLKQGRVHRQYSDGSSYVGECSDGKFNGDGVLTYSDGAVFVGTFVDGKPSVGELRDINGKVLRRYGSTAVFIRK